MSPRQHEPTSWEGRCSAFPPCRRKGNAKNPAQGRALRRYSCVWADKPHRWEGENAACPMNKHSARRSFHMSAGRSDRQTSGEVCPWNSSRHPRTFSSRTRVPDRLPAPGSRFGRSRSASGRPRSTRALDVRYRRISKRGMKLAKNGQAEAADCSTGASLLERAVRRGAGTGSSRLPKGHILSEPGPLAEGASMRLTSSRLSCQYRKARS
jgi:hypothetical protein